MIKRLVVLFSMLSWLGCVTCMTTSCTWTAESGWVCQEPKKVEPCPREDCSKRAKAKWPVCSEDPEAFCHKEKPITECGPGIGNRCYWPRGVQNCVQLWSYQP